MSTKPKQATKEFDDLVDSVVNEPASVEDLRTLLSILLNNTKQKDIGYTCNDGRVLYAFVRPEKTKKGELLLNLYTRCGYPRVIN